MSSPDLLRSMFADSGKAKRRPTRPQLRRIPLRVEELESRITPSVFVHSPTLSPSPAPPPGPPPAPVFPTTSPSLGKITQAGTTVTVTDPASAAALTITELQDGQYQFTLADTQGTSTMTKMNVTDIIVNFTGNVGQTGSVTLNHNAGGALTGKLTVNDTALLANLQVTANAAFDVAGNVTLRSTNTGGTVNVTSTGDHWATNGGTQVAITTAAPTAFSQSSSASLTGDRINDAGGGGLLINIGAGAGQSNTVNLVNDIVRNGVSVTQTGASAGNLSDTITSLTLTNGNLTARQTGGTNASFVVDPTVITGGGITLTDQGVSGNAVASVSITSTTGSVSITQHGGSSNTATLARVAVGGDLTEHQMTNGINSIGIDDTTVAGVIVDGVPETVTLTQNPFAVTNTSNFIEIGSVSSGFPGVSFGGVFHATQGASGGNTVNLGATQIVKFDAFANFVHQNPGSVDAVFVHLLRFQLAAGGTLTVTPPSAEQDLLT